MNNTTTMIDIKELAKQSNLTLSFARKCFRELEPVLRPHYVRGDNNSLLFDSSAVAIFLKIGREKEKNTSLPTIKKIIFTDQEIEELERRKSIKSPDKVVEKPILKPVDKTEKTMTVSEIDRILDLNEKLHNAEMKQMETEVELQSIKSKIKFLLPSGEEDVEILNIKFNKTNQNLYNMQYIVRTLRKETRSGAASIVFGGHSKEMNDLWSELINLIKDCLES